MFYQFIRNYHTEFSGEIFEFGVFQGRSLLATALLLKEVGSNRKVYGFDTFTGFPDTFSDYDAPGAMHKLYEDGLIDNSDLDSFLENKAPRSYLTREGVTTQNFSTSGKLSVTSLEHVERRIGLLGLDNVHLIPGDFSKPFDSDILPDVVFTALLDCDLNAAYIAALNITWPRLNVGGPCFLDEYFSLKFTGPRKACVDFLSAREHRLVRENPPLFDAFERRGVIKCAPADKVVF